MKIAKDEIVLSNFHPSLLLDLKPQPLLCGPLLINREKVLIDGYRRFLLDQNAEIEVVEIETSDLFQAAVAINQRTRLWDETDCYLWMRWAEHLNILEPDLPITKFPAELQNAPTTLIRLLANRKLLFRQGQLIMESPRTYRQFLEAFLSGIITLNANETASFIEIACDLANRMNLRVLEDLLRVDTLAKIVDDTHLSPRQKGEALLKAMRSLRYPYYQKLSEEFSSNWRDFHFVGVQAKKNLFVERGVLEMTLSAASMEEMKTEIQQLYQSLSSPVWNKIWENEHKRRK